MDLFLKAVKLKRRGVPSSEEYPFSIPSIRELDELNIRSLRELMGPDA